MKDVKVNMNYVNCVLLVVILVLVVVCCMNKSKDNFKPGQNAASKLKEVRQFHNLCRSKEQQYRYHQDMAAECRHNAQQGKGYRWGR